MKVVACLVHLNGEYVYHDRSMRLEKLLIISDIIYDMTAVKQR
jgi:hypothetical protein